MPEIPDLEAIRGFLAPRLREHAVASVEVRFPWLVRSAQPLDSLVGHRLLDVRRTGKFLLFDSDDARVLVVNAMLTGRFTWTEGAERRRPGTCVTLAFAGGAELRYSDARRMGRWYLVPADALASVPQFAELGPDALTVDEEAFLQRLARHRGQIKSTLVNQRFLAGIGNAYADEILWEARLHPHRRGSTLSAEERQRLYRALHDTFDWALPILRAEVRERLYQRNEEWRDHLRVHHRAGEPCPRCGEPLRGQTSGSRETNYCLRCQPLSL